MKQLSKQEKGSKVEKKERRGLNRITLTESKLQNKNTDNFEHHRIQYKSDLKLKIQPIVSEVQIQSNIKVNQKVEIALLQYQYQSLHYIPQIIQIKLKSQNTEKKTDLAKPKKEKNKKQISQQFLKKVQKIYLNTNYLKSFENIDFEKLINLKEINLDQNLITNIPAEIINTYKHIKILKLNCNQIQIIPYLKYVTCLELMQNPIKFITSKFQVMVLQILELDWTDYIFPQLIKLNIRTNQKQGQKCQNFKKQNNISYLKKLIEKIRYNTVKINTQSYFQFENLCKKFFEQDSKQQIQQKVALLLFKAIKEEHFFFIRFLKQSFPNLQYNKMNVYNKYLVYLALSSKSQQIISLFRPNMWPYSKNQTEPYLTNILSSIKCHNSAFFKYLVQVNSLFNLNQASRKAILIQIMQNFYEDHADDKKIFHLFLEKNEQDYLSKQKQKNFKMNLGLNELSFNKSARISDFFNYILNCAQLKDKFVVLQTNQLYSNTLLHFAVQAKNFPLTQYCLNNFQANLFQRSAKDHRTPKSMQGIDNLSRKILWKKQKQVIQKFFCSNKQKEKKYEFLMKIQQNFIENLCSQIRKQKELTQKQQNQTSSSTTLSSLKQQLSKIFKDQKQEIDKIFFKSLQENFVQVEQQLIFIFNSIVQSKRLILSENKINQIFYIINKIISRIDKRSYAACQLLKIAFKIKNQNYKQTQDTLNKNICSFIIYQKSFELAQPYEYYYQNAQHDKFEQDKQALNGSYMCGLNVSKLACKKCP